jgi:DNA modification methylase
VQRTAEIEHVSFRKLMDTIPSTTYASHGMFYYPARFIPQVVRWAIDNYTATGDWILDPFAGSGTVCVESLIANRNSMSLDLNPLIEHLVAAKTCRGIVWDALEETARNVVSSKTRYLPKWSRIEYWHPERFFVALSRMWAGYYKSPDPLTLIALLRTTKRFSYGDDTVPKLFKSKSKIIEVKAMSHGDVESRIHQYFLDALRRTYRASKEFEQYYRGGIAKVQGGVDLLKYDFDEDRKFRLLVTSPPYGIAHEYIRSSKLELAWLGLTDKEITALTTSEIPYNHNPPDIEIESKSFRESFSKVKPHVARHCEIYFKSVLHVLGKAMSQIEPGGRAAIFIGNATFSGVEFSFHQIFREHLGRHGFEFERLLADEIKSRRLFKGRLNPSPNGITSEYLLVLRNRNN